MLNEALNYAARGWPVFPLAGKVPHTRHGLKDASTDEKTIYEWWHRWPRANIGYAILPGQVVIDVDPRHDGSANLAKLTAHFGPIPDTLTCITGRHDGGCHFYLIHPGGRLTDRVLPDGIDIRVGAKHYVVAPPSIHPDTGKQYAWANVGHELAPCPRWLADIIRVPIIPEQPRVEPVTGDGSPLVEFVASLTEGNRNNGLYWAARSAADDRILDSSLSDQMVRAAEHAGLSRPEAEAVIASAKRGAA